MNEIINKLVDAFNSRFNLGPLLLTTITVFLLFLNYDDSSGFMLIAGFLVFIIFTSIALMITFMNYVSNGKKEFSQLFNRSFLTILISIISLLLLKTMVSFGLFPLFSIAISVFLFFSTLSELLNHIRSR